MTIEERLNEIVEKQQGDAIIPFLQELTPEERKSLVPCLNKQEEHYNKFVQLEPNTYGTRATPEQHRILNLTALVIYSQKEYSKNYWSINVERLNELISWHIPSWLNSFFKEGEGKDSRGFYNMDYEILMDWLEQGVLKVSPTPQTIAGYLVSYINTTAILLKREITLKEHIWYLFESDCGQNWMDKKNGSFTYCPYKYLIENGKIDRMRVLRESLLATNRNLNKNLCGWFAGMFAALEPSVEEQLALQPEILAVLSAPHSRPINIILGLLKNLCSHPQFQTEEFLSQTSVLFASDVKAIHQNTLAILSKLAKERKEYRDAICCAAAQGLMNHEESIQSKIVQLIQTYGDTESATLKEALSVYVDTMLTGIKQELKPYLEGSYSDITPANPTTNNASFISESYEPIPPIISEENRIPEITSTEDLIFLASQVLEVNEVYHFEQFISSLIQWDAQLEAGQVPQWMPILQRAYKLILSGGNSRTGILDDMMATFLVDYSKLLIRRFPEEGKELNALHEKMVQKDEVQRGQWGFCNLQSLTIRKKRNKQIEHRVHRQLLCHTLDMLESNKPRLPLLSTPTHIPMFIDPEILIQRLKQYQQADVEPNSQDMQIALSRTVLDETTTQLLSTITQELEGEYRNLLLFLFGEKESAPQSPFTHPAWWMTAGLIKSPETVYPEFKDFPYNESPREFLTGNFAWKTYLESHSYIDYTKKVIEWTSSTISIHLPEGQNVRIINKGKYNERAEYHPRTPHPLLVEIYYPQGKYFDEISKDLPRLLWLAPNTPEPLLAWCICQAIYDPMLNEVREVNVTRTTIETFHQFRHTWHEISYLLEASCMLVADKTSRAYAAEIWIERANKGCIDSSRIGRILGSHQDTGWGPLKRLTDLIQQQMMNVSPLHNRELEKLLVALLAELPVKPIKDLKKLLEIYAEILSINNSKAEDERVLHLLDVWKGVANLKKAVMNIKC